MTGVGTGAAAAGPGSFRPRPNLFGRKRIGGDGADAGAPLGEALHAQVPIGGILRLHDREQRVAP